MPTNVKIPLKIGLFGGIAALYVSIVGMIETFGERDMIRDVISLGHILLFMVIMATGYIAVRALDKFINPPHSEEKEKISRTRGLVSGLFAGIVVSVMLIILVLIAGPLDLREVLVNVSPSLIEALTFGQGLRAGNIILLNLGVVLGAIGGVIYVLPDRSRRAIVSSFLWLAFIGMLSDLIRVSLSRPGIPASIPRFLVTSNGLSVAGAVIVVLLTVIFTLFGRRLRAGIRENLNNRPPGQKKAIHYSTWGLILIFMLLLPFIVGVFPSEVLVNIGLYVLMGFGINIVVGMAGLLDLGYVAFFAVGAYSMALLTSIDPEVGGIQLSFWTALPIVIILTGLTGILVGAPVLKMRGDYLAIVTLGFGEIARFIALSDWFKPWLGGAQGIIKIPNIFFGGIEFIGPQQLYYLFLISSLVVLFISWRIKDSRVGRAWGAMREDEDVAEAMGINTVYYKLLAFAIGAMIASVSGAIFAAKLGTIYPHSFNVLVSITALSLLIVGGVGSLPGVVIGAVVLVGLPELLREFAEFRLLFYGALLIIMMLLRPEGLVPSVQRAHELHEEELAQDAWTHKAEAVPTFSNPGTSD